MNLAQVGRADKSSRCAACVIAARTDLCTAVDASRWSLQAGCKSRSSWHAAAPCISLVRRLYLMSIVGRSGARVDSADPPLVYLGSTEAIVLAAARLCVALKGGAIWAAPLSARPPQAALIASASACVLVSKPASLSRGRAQHRSALCSEWQKKKESNRRPPLGGSRSPGHEARRTSSGTTDKRLADSILEVDRQCAQLGGLIDPSSCRWVLGKACRRVSCERLV